ncbi:MAG: hypothetical protein FWF11_04870, partial [Coriobacteriia bacterium]|nr:hypothetical protein [Coriobacteriia bacterium]
QEAPEPVLGIPVAGAADGSSNAAPGEARGDLGNDDGATANFFASLPWFAWAGIGLGIIGAIGAGAFIATNTGAAGAAAAGGGSASAAGAAKGKGRRVFGKK